MSQYDDMRSCIQSTVSHVYNLKCFIKSVVCYLGEPNDVEKILEIKQKADSAEKEIEENLIRLCRMQIRKQSTTKKRINIHLSQVSNKSKKKSAASFELCFKHYLYLYEFSLNSHNRSDVSFKKSLEDLKIKITKKRLIKGIEDFNFTKKDREKLYKIEISFNFGIKLITLCSDGIVNSYTITSAQDSINMKQLISFFEVRWEYDLSTQEKNFFKCIQKAASWIDTRKGIYTELCKVCGMHLNFKSGMPMIPLNLYQGSYYHVDCFYDFQIDQAK